MYTAEKNAREFGWKEDANFDRLNKAIETVPPVSPKESIPPGVRGTGPKTTAFASSGVRVLTAVHRIPGSAGGTASSSPS